MFHPRIHTSEKHAQFGFTLIELLIAVAVAAILMAVAAPSFTRVMAKTNATQTANDLLGDLATARTQAASRNRQVCLTPVNGDWRKGWEVKADSNGDGACDELIRQHGPLNDGFTVLAASGGTTVSTINFRSDGSVDGATADTDVDLCKESGSHPQRVLVKVRASGSARSYRGTAAGTSC